MNLTRTVAVPKSVESFDDTPFYQTQFEFMSVGERLQRINQRINQRIKRVGNKNAPVTDVQPERCTMLSFSVDSKSVTEARHLVISLCRDKLIFMRIKPIQNSSMMRMDMFLRVSIVQRINELLTLRFRV